MPSADSLARRDTLTSMARSKDAVNAGCVEKAGFVAFRMLTLASG